MTSGALPGFDCLLKIGDGGSPENFTTIAELKDISGPNFSKDMIDVTNRSSSGKWREFIAGLKAGTEITFTVNFIPTESTHGYSSGLLKDYVNDTIRNFKLVFSDSGATTWLISAHVKGINIKPGFNNSLEADISLQITGQPTLA